MKPERFQRVKQLFFEARELSAAQRDALLERACANDAELRASVEDAARQVKILDFGVARTTDSDTRLTTCHTDVGQLIGTIPYMSPEQVAGDPHKLDTRSDVYSLGVICFELLAGRLPLDLRDMTIAQAVRVIQEIPPLRLSSVQPTLRGDLSTIVAKALEKDPARRYQSASELREDVKRYLAKQPILAHPPSTAYQLRKLVARHKTPAALLSTLFVVVLVASVGMSILYFRAKHESQTAQRAAQFLENTLRLMHTDQGWPVASIRKVLDDAVIRIDRELGGEPEVEADLRRMVARGYYSIEVYDESFEQFEKALAVAVQVHGRSHADVADLNKQMGDVFYTLSRLDEAERYYRDALGIYRRVQGPECSEAGEILGQLGMIAIWRQDLPTAETLLEEAYAILQR
ncbi:MAG: tetratricopeptide repeat protein [Phycisphaerae bacterium]|nr:tetratricopeptide repeat protein [Phycisphaerae bacterium]